MAKTQLKDVRPIIKAILTERDKMPVTTTERYGFGTKVPYSHGQSFRGGLRAALRIIEQAPVEYASTKWISVNDRLPDDNIDVLVYAIGKKNKPAIVAMTNYIHNMHGYNIKGWRSPWPNFFREYKITHWIPFWMPLPESPEE